jgi:hypothetical protein
MVGLDLVKAFDRIPKEFAAHCAAGYLRKFCPRLSDLVVRLTVTPFEARVGDHAFAVDTGVPQGGILSPWLFAMAMNDLALRLAGAGGYAISGLQLATLLFADDILLADDDALSSAERCRLAKGWVEEWGGEVHPKKTQWLDINATPSPGPGGLEAEDQGRAIDYLGVVLTPKGIKPKVGREVFSDTLRAIRCTIETRGLAPAPALQILRSVAWAKIAHGAAVTLPCAAELTSAWLATARQVLCTFKQVHRAEVLRELGLLYHPVTWLCKAVIRVYGTALTTGRDPVLKRVLVEIVGSPSHPLRRDVEKTLLPTGVTWEELATVPVPDLFRKAEARLREWSRGELLSEATRLGLQMGPGGPLWREWSDGPRKYLYEENARYGFMFRRCSFAPADVETARCYFCGCLSGDWGRHLLECGVATAAVPLPGKLASLSAQCLTEALLLEDAAPLESLRAALSYMKDLYAARARIRDRSPQPVVRKPHVSNPDFFKPGRTAVRGIPTAGRRTKRRRLSTTEVDESRPAPPKRRRRAASPQSASQPWSPPQADAPEQEDIVDLLILLDEPCHDCLVPPEEYPDIVLVPPPALRKRDRDCDGPCLPVSKRLSVRQDTALSPPDLSIQEPQTPELQDITGLHAAVTCNDGPWATDEGEKLAAAVIALGGERSAAKLQRFVPTRTVRQIKVRLTTSGHRKLVERLSERPSTSGVSEARSTRPCDAGASLSQFDERHFGIQGSPSHVSSPGLAAAGPPGVRTQGGGGTRWSAPAVCRGQQLPPFG